MGKEAADGNYGACGVWNCGRGNCVIDRGLGTLTQKHKKTLLHLHIQNKIII